MSRSVMTASGAIATVFLSLPEEYLGEDAFPFDEYIDDVQNVLREHFPSFTPCDNWIGREVHQILSNQHAYVTISEYCGLVSVCLVPREHDYYEDNATNLGSAWCSSIAHNFTKHMHKRYSQSALISQGHASNGEQFFHPVNRPTGLVTSKEGVLW